MQSCHISVGLWVFQQGALELLTLLSLASSLIAEHSIFYNNRHTRTTFTQHFYDDSSVRIKPTFASYNPEILTGSDRADNDELDFSEEEDAFESSIIEDDNEYNSLDSPLSQLPPEEGFVTRYPRDEKWLDKATDDIFDTQQFPLGTLSDTDVESIAGLMAAWVRRRSVKAALTVERLLKRVVDDMRANNEGIHVTARMYTIAMDAWAKSGAEGSAQRAQNIHDAMKEMYEETGDPAIQPSAISYNTVINAHAKSSDPKYLENAERVLWEMINSGKQYAKPDAISFSTIMDAYARSEHTNATKRAEELFDLMDEIKVRRNVFTFSALQNVYARSGLPDAPEKTEGILHRMQDLYDNGDLFAKPNCVNYNALLSAYSRCSNRTTAKLADDILRKMEMPVSEGGFDVEPDRMSYALAILTCSRCPDTSFGSYKANEILERMEARAKEDERKRQEVSSVAPPNVQLDLESFNVVLTAFSRSRMSNAVERIVAIIKRMEYYAENGQEHVRPTIRSWNALLNAIARSRDKDSYQRAERVLTHMYELHSNGVPLVRPDEFSFAAVLSAYKKSSDPRAAERADDMLREMEKLYENGELDQPPDVYHYTIVCATWAKSGQQRAPNRVMQILSHMTELDAQGVPLVRPNVRTYNAVLDCLSRGEAEEEAERLLDHMLILSNQGERSVDYFSFNTVINAFCRSNKNGSGRRAESILERFLDYSEDDPKCMPDSRSFTQIIAHYRRSNEPDAPYRAEYLLNRMISLFEAGHHQLAPNVFAFKLVMDAYSSVKHPDSGATAERLLKQMRDLQKKYVLSDLNVDNTVIYCVLYAWSISGDFDAGRRAEVHLDDMERKYEAGNESLKPDSRCYGLVLNAWSKSSSFDKAKRSLGILKRMEAQHQKGNEDARLNEHVLSLVINSCAFTNSGVEAEAEAFRIAVLTLDKMLASDHCQPSSLTYGWFIQACGRLHVPEKLKNEQIERAWKLCCENGLVNGFVLHRFTGAAPEALYKKLMKPVLKDGPRKHDSKERLKFFISPKILPSEWTRNNKGMSKKGDSGNSGWWADSDC